MNTTSTKQSHTNNTSNTMKNNQLSLFNRNLLQLLQELNKDFNDNQIDISKHYSEIVNNPLLCDTFCVQFMKNVNKDCVLFSKRDETLFKVSNEWFPHLDISLYWNKTESTSLHNTLWQYLHTLYIYSYNYTNNITNINGYVSSLKNKDTRNDEESSYILILKNLSKFKQKNNENTPKVEQKSSNSSLPDLESMTEGLLGSSMGKLAVEIAQDINPEDFNLNNPQDLLSSLFGGGEPGQNNGFMKLVEKIGNHMQTKMEDGSLSEQDLLADAGNIMGQMNSHNPSMTGNIFQQMQSMMGSLGGDFENMSKSTIKKKVGQMNLGMKPGEFQANIKKSATRDRLRKKLERQRAQRALDISNNKTVIPQQTQNKNQVENSSSVNSSSKSKKKRRKRKKSKHKKQSIDLEQQKNM